MGEDAQKRTRKTKGRARGLLVITGLIKRRRLVKAASVDGVVRVGCVVVYAIAQRTFPRSGSGRIRPKRTAGRCARLIVAPMSERSGEGEGWIFDCWGLKLRRCMMMSQRRLQ